MLCIYQATATTSKVLARERLTGSIVPGYWLAKCSTRPALAKSSLTCWLASLACYSNNSKCTWEPTLKLKWLGFDLDLGICQISVLEDKLSSLKMRLQVASYSTSIKARPLASITGKIISMSIAMGPVTCLMTRSMYALFNARQF